MQPARRLLLRREALGELGPDQLRAVAGGPQIVQSEPSTRTYCTTCELIPVIDLEVTHTPTQCNCG